MNFYDIEALRTKLDEMMARFMDEVKPEIEEFINQVEKPSAEDIVSLIAMEEGNLYQAICDLNEHEGDALLIHQTLVAMKADQFLRLIANANSMLNDFVEEV